MALSGKDADPGAAKIRTERRHHGRVRLALAGRLFIPGDETEAHCTVLDLSPGGAAIDCEIIPEHSTPVVLYVEGFGRFEGRVTRRGTSDFGVAFASTSAKRERTARKITAFLNKTLGYESALSRHARGRGQGFAKFTRADGQIVNCEIMDMSVGGVSLKTETRPPIGEFVLIAQIAGRVARHHTDGIGIEFVGQERHPPEHAINSFRQS
jgi:hypothetical protein